MSGNSASTSSALKNIFPQGYKHRVHRRGGRDGPRPLSIPNWNGTNCSIEPKSTKCSVAATASLYPYPLKAMEAAAPMQVAVLKPYVGPNMSTLEGVLIPIGGAILLVLMAFVCWCWRERHCCRKDRARISSPGDLELGNPRNGRQARPSPPPRRILSRGNRAALKGTPSHSSYVSCSSKACIQGLKREPNGCIVHDHGHILGPPHVGILRLGPYSSPTPTGEPLRSWGNDLEVQGNRNAVVILTETPQERRTGSDEIRWSSSERTLRASMVSSGETVVEEEGHIGGNRKEEAGPPEIRAR
jgi:hypothetical protein